MKTDKHTPTIFWIIGLPNAGKTAVAKELQKELRLQGRDSFLLDGDAMREVMQLELSSYDLESRMAQAKRIGRMATLLQQQGATVIVAANTLFHKVQHWNRKNLPNYFEIFLKTDENTRRKRDGEKNLYKRYDKGEISQVLGLDLIAEEPENPDLLLNTTSLTPREIALLVISNFKTA